MIEAVITIRNAREGDAEGIAEVHDAAWRDAYRGLIPGRELEQMIARRGPRWWHSAIVGGSRLLEVARKDLAEHGYSSFLVWALADNERAVEFYLKLGGRKLCQGTERFGSEIRGRTAFAFD